MHWHATSANTNRGCVYLLAYLNPDGDAVLNLGQGNGNVKNTNNTKCNERNLTIENLLGRNKARSKSPRFINDANQLVEQIGVSLLTSQYIKQTLANEA